MFNNQTQTEEYKIVIEEILSKSQDTLLRYILVDDVYKWDRDNNINTAVEGDIALSIRSKNLIILSKTISADKKRQVLDGIDERISFAKVAMPRTFTPSRKIIDTDEKFIAHTVWHEVGHLKGHAYEGDADVFAFEQLGFNTTVKVKSTF